jgi:hypothetical protein
VTRRKVTEESLRRRRWVRRRHLARLAERRLRDPKDTALSRLVHSVLAGARR